MAQPRGLLARPASRARKGSPGSRERRASPRLVLCILPRKLRANPLRPLLPGYEVSVADTSTQTLRLARRHTYDLYIVYSPLGWIDAADMCRKIRAFDAHTPLIVYCTQPNAIERREVIAAGAQAYVARSDDARDVPGAAGQLIMLAELRSMEAMTSGGKAIQMKLARRLAKLDYSASQKPSAQRAEAHERLKAHARKLFAQAGGSRANFERLWPSIYEGALRQLGEPRS